MFVRIFTDGSARGNPNGPGGYGCILQYMSTNRVLYETTCSAGYKKTTNNRMELLGVITGIGMLKRSCDIEIVSDSKYVTDAFNQRWIENWLRNDWKKSSGEPVKNVDMWKVLLRLVNMHHVRFRWVKGHASNPENNRCDALATTAADGTDLLEDTLLEW